MPDNDAAIIESWQRNATPWTDAVRNDRIGTRLRVTNAGVLAAITEREPRSVIDLGCGEGWLSRTSAASGLRLVQTRETVDPLHAQPASVIFVATPA